MKTFEDIQSQWEDLAEPKIPKDGARLVLEKIRALKRKQRIASTVLIGTVAILLFFFFYITAYRSTPTMIGLFMMMGALLVRIVLEVLSIKSLGKINMDHETTKFKEDLITYFLRRRWIHFLISPLVFVVYIIGFWMLLPAFKETLSSGFYTYIVVSSIVVLTFLAGFISYHIYKEHMMLKSFKTNDG